MPLVSVILPGKQGYLDWKWVINGKEIPYGLFLGEVVNFLIVAAGAVPLHRQVPRLGDGPRRKRWPPPRRLTKDQELLAEIRDLLKHRESAA